MRVTSGFSGLTDVPHRPAHLGRAPLALPHAVASGHDGTAPVWLPGRVAGPGPSAGPGGTIVPRMGRGALRGRHLPSPSAPCGTAIPLAGGPAGEPGAGPPGGARRPRAA